MKETSDSVLKNVRISDETYNKIAKYRGEFSYKDFISKTVDGYIKQLSETDSIKSIDENLSKVTKTNHELLGLVYEVLYKMGAVSRDGIVKDDLRNLVKENG